MVSLRQYANRNRDEEARDWWREAGIASHIRDHSGKIGARRYSTDEKAGGRRGAQVLFRVGCGLQKKLKWLGRFFICGPPRELGIFAKSRLPTRLHHSYR